MDKREAQRVIKILLECDGGCEYCAARQIRLFCEEFPEYLQEAKKVYFAQFGKEFEKAYQER